MTNNQTFTDYVTEDQIQLAEDRGATKAALDWLREEPRTLEQVGQKYPRWLLEKMGHELYAHSPQLFELCVRREPWVALRYVRDSLSQELFEFCARREPWAVWIYAPARLYRTPSLFEFCAREEPGQALTYAHDELDAHSPQLLEFCAKKEPGAAAEAIARLERQAAAIRKAQL